MQVLLLCLTRSLRGVRPCYRNWIACVFIGALVLIGSSRAPANTTSSDAIQLPSTVDLGRLVDLCSERLGLDIEYDSELLRGKITLRLEHSLTPDELLALTIQLLSTQDLTTLRQTEQNLLSVVKVSEAAERARIDASLDTGAGAGYVKIIHTLQHRSAESAVTLLKQLLSKSGSVVEALESTNQILVADLQPRIAESLRVLNAWDVPEDPLHIDTITLNRLSAIQVVSLVKTAVVTRDLVMAEALPGQITALPDDSAVLIVAPERAFHEWTELVQRFDDRGDVAVQTYRVLYFGLDEVRSLIEATCRQPIPRGSGEQWRLIEDNLTGTLIVTATPAEHQSVESLIERLNSSPGASTRPMRVFPIRNRGVTEILTILEQLVDRGALEASSNFTADHEYTSTSEALSQAQRSSSQISPSSNDDSLDSPSTTIADNRRALPKGVSESDSALELTADEGTNTLIAIGEPRLLEQLGSLIAQLDKRQPQVKIDVLVVGLTDANTHDLGVELQKLEVSGNTLISLASLFGLSSGSLAAGTVSSSGTGFSGVVLNPGDFSVVIRALETINDGRTVNMPHLLVNNNQNGTLNSVLQEPFTSTNASDTVATTSFAGTQDAGTTVTVRPQIAEGDHLVLEYSVAISNFVGESSTPGIPPPRQQNSLQSVVTIPDGYTIAVGGVEVLTDADSVSQVPVFGDIPGFGELFKNRSNTRSRSRFFVFIRSTVLRHSGFEDLKYLSDVDVAQAGVDDGWPEVQPRLIR